MSCPKAYAWKSCYNILRTAKKNKKKKTRKRRKRNKTYSLLCVPFTSRPRLFCAVPMMNLARFCFISRSTNMQAKQEQTQHHVLLQRNWLPRAGVTCPSSSSSHRKETTTDARIPKNVFPTYKLHWLVPSAEARVMLTVAKSLVTQKLRSYVTRAFIFCMV